MKSQKEVEEFVGSFFDLLDQTLPYNEFIKEVKEKYWLQEKRWLADLLPWSELKKLKIKPNIKVHMLSDTMGLLSISFELLPTLYTSFSLLKKDNKWFLDWQNSEVWLLATKTWKNRKEANLEIRFSDSFKDEEIEVISEELHKINQWILEEFVAEQERLVIVLGFDSLEYFISGTGEKPNSRGGNSRGKLILMSENLPGFRNKTFESIYFESVLLHEMIHEYSCYDKLWKGSITDPSMRLALINEGVAFYYQHKFFGERIKSINYSKDEPRLIKIKKGIEEALNYNSSIFKLMDSQEFNKFNQINPEADNPAYFIAASLYAYLLTELGFEKVREVYSQAGKMESKQAIEFLVNYVNEEEYLTFSKAYFNDIVNQIFSLGKK